MNKMYIRKAGTYEVLCLFCFFSFLSFFSFNTFAQVGIGTTTPNGILEVNSTNTGVVLPRLALAATNVMAPATNPKTGGTIPTGTVVYNTTTSATGVNDVYPGIYVWVVDKWVPQYAKKQTKIFVQSSLQERIRSDEGAKAISGLTNSFTAKYTGVYKIEINVNYGGGNAKSPVPNTTGPSSSRRLDYLNIARASGNFNLTFGSTQYIIPASAYSTGYHQDVDATSYFLIWRQFNRVEYVNLTAGSVNNFSLSFDQDPAPEFIQDGNGSSSSYNGRGAVGYDIPCTIEITYMGEQ